MLSKDSSFADDPTPSDMVSAVAMVALLLWWVRGPWSSSAVASVRLAAAAAAAASSWIRSSDEVDCDNDMTSGSFLTGLTGKMSSQWNSQCPKASDADISCPLFTPPFVDGVFFVEH